MAENAPNDSRIQTKLTKSLSNAKFKDIQASVQNDIVSRTWTVNVYGVKADTEKKARRVKNVDVVRDDIQVADPAVPDQVLRRKLLGTIRSDRIGYGRTAFNAISVSIENGVVTLAGTAYGPVDKDSAVTDATDASGAIGVVDNI
jgi:hyperosmotically inducible protein